ncbi:protein translocase subunit SecY [Algimonas ampicilliniresistens]|uniref:Protein translocase subunit SecY n=1 Tax=Algimonas ampicilliniresistens TaxID=1298735 RepID=A0ABQ5V4Z6_9PROT|nr:preprotein translocase subunit SecY [Algimonas ampicilliniresistens]GLQ22150.1 protein translocase subunit SecY [Algimonas ampicilliniresistens]
MVSAAEQLAQNFRPGTFLKAKELQQRLLFTLGILIIYRLGTYIPVPGVDLGVFQGFLDSGTSGGFGDRLNMFSGGAVERMAVFALNVMPYISASIIMTLMKGSVPSLKELDKEGQQGRQQINQYTRYLTLVLAAFQAFGVAKLIENSGAAINPGLFFQTSTVITLVGGTMFLMWLGEQVTARGVGNGVSLIIFAGIVAELPRAIFQVFSLNSSSSVVSTQLLLFLIVMFIALSMLIVYVERAQRRLLVQYPKRQMARGQQFGGESSFMPLKLNTAGVIPPIFASSLLILPTTLAPLMLGQDGSGASGIATTLLAALGYGQPIYLALYGLLIVFFCYFYVPYVFKPDDVADNLRKNGGFLPGIRPGARTADYLTYVLSRLTFIGAFYVAFVCVVPEIVIAQNDGIPPSVAMLIGGMSLLIIVSVTLDTVAQIQSHLIAHQYEGLIKKSRMRRRAKKK